jgi:hypothetical protein
MLLQTTSKEVQANAVLYMDMDLTCVGEGVTAGGEGVGAGLGICKNLSGFMYFIFICLIKSIGM